MKTCPKCGRQGGDANETCGFCGHRYDREYNPASSPSVRGGMSSRPSAESERQKASGPLSIYAVACGILGSAVALTSIILGMIALGSDERTILDLYEFVFGIAISIALLAQMEAIHIYQDISANTRRTTELLLEIQQDLRKT